MNASPLRTTVQLRSGFLFSLTVLLLLGGLAACDDTASPEEPISIRITQPADSQTVSGNILRIMTETSSQCGCNAHVEFYIDGVHVYSHYQPFYYYDWNITDLTGEHTILAKLVVIDHGDASDSVRVFIRE